MDHDETLELLERELGAVVVDDRLTPDDETVGHDAKGPPTKGGPVRNIPTSTKKNGGASAF